MTLMVQFLVISATQHTPHNKLIDNIVHVIVNTINDVDEVVIYDVGSLWEHANTKVSVLTDFGD